MSGVKKASREVECPKCGHKFPVKVAKSAVGEGTQSCRGLKKLNKNHMNLARLIYDQGEKARFCVRQVQNLIYPKIGPPAFGRWVKGDRRGPSAGWDKHYIQSHLSCIVGADMMCMTQGVDEHWSQDEQRFVTNPVPFYFMDWLQRIRWETVQHTGKIAKLDKRPAADRNKEGW